MEKNFDRILEEKLGRLKVDYDPKSWELLEQRLDTELAGTPEVEDNEIDEVIFDKLHRVEAPYDSGHWKLMAARLESEFFLARQILRYKVLEVGLVALLLLTFVQYLPLPTNNDRFGPFEPNTPQPTQKDQKIESESPSAQPAPLNRPVASAAETDGPVEARNTDSGEPAIASIVPPSSNDGRTEETDGAFQRMLPLSKKPGLLDIPPREAAGLSAGQLADEPATETAEKVHGPVRAGFVTAALDPLYPGALRYSGQDGAEVLEFLPNRRKTYFRVGMFGSMDYNRVITPADESLGLERLSRYTPGYGGGLTFGLEFGRWETETGLIYAAKQYQARPIVFFQGSFRDGYLGKGVKDIEINVINVPLNFRYNFLRTEKWRMYALAGASIQVAVQANYYTANQDGFRSASFAPAPAPASFGASNAFAFRTLADDLPGGWFEGGTFEENGYLTGNLGLGFERYFGGQWSLFVQPTYQHAINYFLRGLGPTRDEINTLSLYTGIRLRLQK